MQPQFVFLIHDLQQGGMRDVDAPLSHEWLSDALDTTEVLPVADRPGRVQLRITMSGRDVIVRGSVSAPVTAECGRCLTATPIDIATELALFLMPEKGGASRSSTSKGAKGDKGKPAAGERATAPKSGGGKSKPRRDNDEEGHEFTAEEADADTYVGDELVLDSFIREAILLEIPIFPLCSEECPGIGPVPAAPVDATTVDPPIDPRLAPLLALKKKS